MKKLFKVLGKIFGLLLAVYAAAFAIFYFDLDGKLLYHVVEPALDKHYSAMKRRNPFDVPYKTGLDRGETLEKKN
ncbi:MAG: hypothetical protein IKR08_06170 [Firmicutes bacterium]|nr:hypothetical protein [Bacillota bacterium]